MAYKYLALFNDKSFNSETRYDVSPMYAIRDDMCMFIKLPNASITEELEKRSTEGDPMIGKLTEIISKMSTDPRHENSRTRIGVIYFKNENDEVFPKLCLYEEFRDFIWDNFPKAVINLKGVIKLEGGSSACSYSKSKRFNESCSLQQHITSLTLTSPFPFGMIQPINNCHFTLQSFSLSIGWEDAEWLAEIEKPSSNHVLETLFKEQECPPKDFVLVAGNEAEIPCHGMILGAQSPALSAMVNPSETIKEVESRRIEMKMFSEATLNAIVSYIYCQPLPFATMDCKTALELFRLGHMYQLLKLAKMVAKMMLQKGEEWFSPNCILELHFLLKNLSEFNHLADHAVNIMLKLADAVRHCERYQELNKEEVIELLWILLSQATRG